MNNQENFQIESLEVVPPVASSEWARVLTISRGKIPYKESILKGHYKVAINEKSIMGQTAMSPKKIKKRIHKTRRQYAGIGFRCMGVVVVKIPYINIIL